MLHLIAISPVIGISPVIAVKTAIHLPRHSAERRNPAKFQMVSFSGFRVFARNDKLPSRYSTSKGAGKLEPPSSLFPRAKPQGMKPLMTHCFLQLTINPEAGEDGNISTQSQRSLAVKTYDPRLDRRIQSGPQDQIGASDSLSHTDSAL